MNLIFVLLLSNNTELSIFTTDQLQIQVMLYLKAFDTVWSIGLIVFGGHLLIVGTLGLKSSRVPKWISILLLIASIGYILIHLCKVFLPEHDELMKILEIVFIAPMTAGELGFGFWLLFRGGRVSEKE
jgi:hypothetical protein